MFCRQMQQKMFCFSCVIINLCVRGYLWGTGLYKTGLKLVVKLFLVWNELLDVQ
jgi:hypothetical protein